MAEQAGITSWHSARLMAEEMGFYSWKVQEIYLFSTASKPALGPTQRIQWVPGAFPRVKQSGCEADHSFPTSAMANNACSITSTLPYTFMAWCLTKHSDNFTLSLPHMADKDFVTKIILKLQLSNCYHKNIIRKKIWPAISGICTAWL
jgi:hypothetical protein